MKISLGTTYYNNPKNIKKLVDHHLDYVDELIIVDDGSSDIYHILNYVKPSEKIKIYRVKKDYGFNSHGCRNLIMKEASNEFVILIDSDRAIHDPKEAIESIKQKNLKRNVLYRFVGHFNKLGSEIHESVNDFLISKTHFFSAGGYDEELIGVRNGDRQYFERLKFFGREKILYDVNFILLRSPSVKNKHKEIIVSKNDRRPSKNIMEIIERRMKHPEPNKKILTFEWERLI